MKLATSTNIAYTRPDGKQIDFLESMDLCKQAGYEYLDMNFVDAARFNKIFQSSKWKDYIYQIKDKADELGLTFIQAHSSIHNFCDKNLSKSEFCLQEENVIKSLESASILEIPWVIFHPETEYSTGYTLKESKRKNIEYLSNKLEIAEKLNIGISLENMWDLNISPKRRYCVTGEELKDLVESLSVNFNNVSICCDVEHLALMGLDFKTEFEIYGDHLKCTHVSDFKSIKDDHILPFYGKINWNNCMSSLKQVGYEGYLTYEIHNYCTKVPDNIMNETLKYSITVGEELIRIYDEA